MLSGLVVPTTNKTPSDKRFRSPSASTLAPDYFLDSIEQIYHQLLPFDKNAIDWLDFGDLPTDAIQQIVKLSPNRFLLKSDTKQLVFELITYQNVRYAVIGNRLYQINSDSQKLDISQIISDPLLWMANHQLVEFFADYIQVATSPVRPPRSVRTVEWDADLDTQLPFPEDYSAADMETVKQQLTELAGKDTPMSTFLKQHYRLCLYFGELAEKIRTRQPHIPASALGLVSQISDERVNELLFYLMGANPKHMVSPIISQHSRKFYAILRKIAEQNKIDTIETTPVESTEASRILVERIGSMMTKLDIKQIQNFKNLDELLDAIYEKTGWDLGISIEGKTMKLDFTALGVDTRAGKRSEQVEAPLQSVSRIKAKERIVASTLAHIGKTSFASDVNQLFATSANWQEGWALTMLLQGLAANIQVKPSNPDQNPFDNKSIGIVRGGFGLGGASGETQQWVRNIFSTSNMFNTRCHMLAGEFKDETDFGPKTNSNRNVNYFLDGYKYKNLSRLIFSQDTIAEKDLAKTAMDIEQLIEDFSSNTKSLGGLDSAANLAARKYKFFSQRNLQHIYRMLILQGKASNGQFAKLDDNTKIMMVQAMYDFLVDETRRAFINWADTNNLSAIYIGQIALPVENPVVYAGFLKALNEINARPNKNVIGLIRQNYFRPMPAIRKELSIKIPQRHDNVEIFVESKTNARIFEKMFGFSPSIISEGVPIVYDKLRQVPEAMTSNPLNIGLSATSLANDFDTYNEIKGFNNAQNTLDTKIEEAYQRQGLNMPNQQIDFENDIIIVHPSRMDANKRPDTTMELAAKLQQLENKTHPDNPKKVRVVFLGRYISDPKTVSSTNSFAGNEARTFEEITQLASDSDMSDQVYFLGTLSQNETLTMLSRATIMSQPSDRETFGRTPMEAIASGTPIIVSRNYRYPYFEGDYPPVFSTLFKGFTIHTYSGGYMNQNGEWVPGPSTPSAEMLTRILDSVYNPELRKENRNFNQLLLSRSNMNLANIESFLRLWFQHKQISPGMPLVFEDATNFSPAVYEFQILTEALRAEKIPEELIYAINSLRHNNGLSADQTPQQKIDHAKNWKTPNRHEPQVAKIKIPENEQSRIWKAFNRAVLTTIDSERIYARIWDALDMSNDFLEIKLSSPAARKSFYQSFSDVINKPIHLPDISTEKLIHTDNQEKTVETQILNQAA